jgi:hypothetical protein
MNRPSPKKIVSQGKIFHGLSTKGVYVEQDVVDHLTTSIILQNIDYE